MLTPDHKGAQRALEQAIAAERAKLVSAHAVQKCLYQVLLYAEGEDAVVHAEAAHVVATLVENAVDKLDSVSLRRVMEEAELGETVERDPIEGARRRSYQAVNAELVGLYWQLGEYISRKIESAEWGDSVVDELVAAIARQYPGLRGYTRPNLFRMRQFYEAYRSNEIVSPLVRQLPWTHSRTLTYSNF
jgi:hypothetical protein